MESFLLESQRYNNAGTGEKISLDWTKVDVNSSALRIIYKNAAGNPGPVSLTSNNWENVDIDPALEPGDELSFSKSWTAFIPGIFGILLILLARGAQTLPNARKHIMHVAVLIGLIGFAVSTKKIGSAVAEMNWLKNEPYGIVHASMLKPLSMLLTSGLLFIFVILCINSFISARREKAAQAKLDEEKKKKILQKVKNKNASATDTKSSSDKKDSDDKDSDEVIDEQENSSVSKDNSKIDSEKNKDVSDSEPLEGDQKKDRFSPTNDSPAKNDDKKEDTISEDNKEEKVSIDSKDSSEDDDSESKKDTEEESQDHKD